MFRFLPQPGQVLAFLITHFGIVEKSCLRPTISIKHCMGQIVHGHGTNCVMVGRMDCVTGVSAKYIAGKEERGGHHLNAE